MSYLLHSPKIVPGLDGNLAKSFSIYWDNQVFQGERPTIICMSGASGSGKTTLARALSEHLSIPFQSTSAGDLFTPSDKELLTDLSRGNWKQSGHAEVIKLSLLYPEFGKMFQSLALIRRGGILFEAYHTGQSLIVDRSPLDNLVYYLSQVGSRVSNEEVTRFLDQAKQYLESISHFIYVSYQGVGEVEVNNSRVSNLEYQHHIDSTFNRMFYRHFLPSFTYLKVPAFVIRHWDADLRVKQCLEFITLCK